MSWLVWRQGRSENALLAALLGALAPFLLLTGAHMHSVFDAEGLSPCATDAEHFHGVHATGAELPAALRRPQPARSMARLAPGLIGVLLAAPLVLELDQGTYRLAWTQSITPRRWLTTRLGAADTRRGSLRRAADRSGELLASASRRARWPRRAQRVRPRGRRAALLHAVRGRRRARDRDSHPPNRTRGRRGLRRVPAREARLEERPRTPARAATQPHSPPARAARDTSRLGNQPELHRARRTRTPTASSAAASTRTASLDNQLPRPPHIFSSWVYEPASHFWPLQGSRQASSSLSPPH